MDSVTAYACGLRNAHDATLANVSHSAHISFDVKGKNDDNREMQVRGVAYHSEIAPCEL